MLIFAPSIGGGQRQFFAPPPTHRNVVAPLISALLYTVMFQITFPFYFNFIAKVQKKIHSPTEHSLRRQFTAVSIEKFKTYLQAINWLHDCPSLYTGDPNLAYNEFLKVFNRGIECIFPKKSCMNLKYLPRKEWMTAGLAKSCEKKSKLFKAFKTSTTLDAITNVYNTRC
jgi:hypothetical protein